MPHDPINERTPPAMKTGEVQNNKDFSYESKHSLAAVQAVDLFGARWIQQSIDFDGRDICGQCDARPAAPGSSTCLGCRHLGSADAWSAGAA